MKRILIIDTYYPPVIQALPVGGGIYDEELRKVLNFSFGTADFYSRNLQHLGWDANDVIANHDGLQDLWARDHHCHEDTLTAQIRYYEPDVVFLQDLSLVDRIPRGNYLLAGQCSCPWPGDDKVRQFDVLFTSFPHYVKKFEALGVKAVFNPLGFDPIVRERTEAPAERDIDVSFVGGVGAPSHWRYGMEVLNAVAENIPAFKWWGYGAELLPSNSALRDKYQGEAFGLDMYNILRRSKIVLNRHGEVAENYANNMRMFEATGCGALLLTEHKHNLSDFFKHHYEDFMDQEVLSYSSPTEAVDKIHCALDRPVFAETIAQAGQGRTLRDHTYAQRMKTVSDSLHGMLVHA